jgi:di/tricarboxylate transporter
VRKYRLEGRQFRVRILPGSMLIGQTLSGLRLRTTQRVAVVAIEKPLRRGRTILSPVKNEPLEADEVLLLEVLDPLSDREALRSRLGVQLMQVSPSYFTDHFDEVGMVEVLLPPESGFIGRSIIDVGFRSRYGLTAVGLRRNLAAFDQPFSDEKLQAGDTLLLVGAWKSIKALRGNQNDFIVLNLPSELEDVSPVARRAPFAVLSLLLMVVLMISGIVPNVLAGLIACLLMGIFGCITMESAYRSIQWSTLILVIGMLPFAIALQKTGGVQLAAGAMIRLLGGAGPYALLAGIFVVTMITGLFVSNTATAVLMAPVAISTAQQTGASPYPFAMIVALAASSAFITPVSSPVNMLVVEPGSYRFMDFVKVGLPFALLVMLLSLLLVPWLLPL